MCGCGGRHVKGRACTTEAKRAILERLLRAWNQHPASMQRLGQLLRNADRESDLFRIEDDLLLDRVEAFAATKH